MGVENSPGHEIEETSARMDRLLTEFENDGENRVSPFQFVADRLKNEIMIEGGDVDHLKIIGNPMQTYLLHKIPDFADRELLTQAIYNKYLYTKPENPEEGVPTQEESAWRKHHDEEADVWEEQMKRGVTYRPYVKLNNQLSDAEMVFKFLNLVNNQEFAAAEAERAKEREEAERKAALEKMKQEQEAERERLTERAEEIFENYQIRVPKRNNPSEMSEEISLKQYTEGILNLSRPEQEFRISHLGANFKIAFSQAEIHALLSKYEEDVKMADKAHLKALQEKETVPLIHMVEEDEEYELEQNIKKAETDLLDKKRMRNIISFAITDAGL
jgi:hypothetical protein